jgi:hypothetical protein
MYIYKLKYSNIATAITDLIAKGVIDTNENNTSITQAVVELGVLILDYGNETTAPTYADGYHFDVMVNEAIDFGTARVTPTNVKHAFLGFNTNEYNQINPNNNTNETTTY